MTSWVGSLASLATLLPPTLLQPVQERLLPGGPAVAILEPLDDAAKGLIGLGCLVSVQVRHVLTLSGPRPWSRSAARGPSARTFPRSVDQSAEDADEGDQDDDAENGLAFHVPASGGEVPLEPTGYFSRYPFCVKILTRMKLHDPTHNYRLSNLIADASISRAEARRIISAELCAEVPEGSFMKWFRPLPDASWRPAPAWAAYVLEAGLRRRGKLPLARSRARQVPNL